MWIDLEAPILVPGRVFSWGTWPRMARAPCDATCITVQVRWLVLSIGRAADERGVAWLRWW